MNRVLRDLVADLRAFVEQRDTFAQVVHALDTETAIVLQALKAVEQEMESDLFLLFVVPCRSAAEFMDAVVARARITLEQANEIRRLDEEGPLPGVPALCEDPTQTHAARLQGIIEHFRGLVGDPTEHRMVLVFLPLTVEDRAGYASIVTSLLPRSGHEYWMRGVRIVLREDAAQPFLWDYIVREQIPDVQVMDVDLRPERLIGALAEETADPQTPQMQRMTGLIQLAALDFTYRRHEDAISKYKAVYNWAAQNEQPVMQGLCLHGIGEVLRYGGGSLDAAKRSYQQGLAVCAGEKHGLPVTLNLVVSAGDVCLALGEHEDAYGYFEVGDQIAAKLYNAITKVDLMLKRGDVRLAQSRESDAVKLWAGAADLCKELKIFDQWLLALDRQEKLFSRYQLRDRLRQIEDDRRLVAAMRKEAA